MNKEQTEKRTITTTKDSMYYIVPASQKAIPVHNGYHTASLELIRCNLPAVLPEDLPQVTLLQLLKFYPCYDILPIVQEVLVTIPRHNVVKLRSALQICLDDLNKLDF